MSLTMNKFPSLKNLTENYGACGDVPNAHLQKIVQPHLQSFDYFVKHGIHEVFRHLDALQFELPSGEHMSLSASEPSLLHPQISSNALCNKYELYPAECRSRGISYLGAVEVNIEITIQNTVRLSVRRKLGDIPIMVRSMACNIANLSPSELVGCGEEAEEMGGYFIINGNEKIVRLLINSRRNYPMAVSRNSWKERGSGYTKYGVTIRCVSQDETTLTNTLHYLSSGMFHLTVTYNKNQFFLPAIIIMKALTSDMTDNFLYGEVVRGHDGNAGFKRIVKTLLRLCNEEGYSSHREALKMLGQKFRVKLPAPPWFSDVECGQFLLDKCVLIHLDSNYDKFQLLAFMMRKLYTFADQKCCEESPDSPCFQEVLTPGSFFQALLKEQAEMFLIGLKYSVLKGAKNGQVLDRDGLTTVLSRCKDITSAMVYTMASGNIRSQSGLGLMQSSGLTIVAEKLNFYRYLSHFRSIHRGAFFSEMRTTTVRRLLPEAWGFLCPVHTPDGTPCGLLNHLTNLCQISVQYNPVCNIPRLLIGYGMKSLAMPSDPSCFHYQVQLDGRLIGSIDENRAAGLVQLLRELKTVGHPDVPNELEIAFVPTSGVHSQYPGLFLFSQRCRFMRPVKSLRYDCVELIGSFEQLSMNICVSMGELIPDVTTHCELSDDSFLSILAMLTPFSNHNQSPRNMYQCQMGKQTMGTPLHAFAHRNDNKLYRLITPQSPLVRPAKYDICGIDNYPLGTNAVIAVISYTGYDMEDAMVINKASYERGFCHGCIYKHVVVDLTAESRTAIFALKEGTMEEYLDVDGLPYVGRLLMEGEPYYSIFDSEVGKFRTVNYKLEERAYVDKVKCLGNDLGNGGRNKVCIVLRIVRNPAIGDKFASRHGQKGICSVLLPQHDMPFTESGIIPDILFNPHGYPSRMTIGMMIESMAGKVASLRACCFDASPFAFSEELPAIEFFGTKLAQCGYNYYGSERMYNGMSGCELEADIFVGTVYYQRLRHMVSDKFQVRTTGPVDPLTRQPVKGRKRHGGIRFGEMERDALISHGASFLLQDRLLNCSDKSLAYICLNCSSILSPVLKASTRNMLVDNESERHNCMMCREPQAIRLVTIPHVFRYLVTELLAMNIEVKVNSKQIIDQ